LVRRATLVTTNIPLVGTLGPGTIRAFFRAILGAFSSGSISLKIRSNKKAATDLKLMGMRLGEERDSTRWRPRRRRERDPKGVPCHAVGASGCGRVTVTYDPTGLACILECPPRIGRLAHQSSRVTLRKGRRLVGVPSEVDAAFDRHNVDRRAVSCPKAREIGLSLIVHFTERVLIIHGRKQLSRLLHRDPSLLP